MTNKNIKRILVKSLKILGFAIVVLLFFSVFMTILYRWVSPPLTPLMVIRKIENGLPINYKWVSLGEIPQSMVNIAVAAEDNNFLAHGGIDFGAVKKAIDEHKKQGRIRGASTISQQVAKNVFLWQNQSWLRKGAEVYFTFLIELFWSKARIMEVYLNVIEMGNGIYGAEAAAKFYFGKNAKNLTPYQSALIVASFPSPLKYNPRNPSNYLIGRANDILSLSYKIGKIKFDKTSIDAAKERYRKRNC